MILPNGQMGQLYFGKKVHLREDYSYLLGNGLPIYDLLCIENERTLSLEHIKQEYGVYGSSDYRLPAVEILQDNGSRICDFVYRTSPDYRRQTKTGRPSRYLHRKRDEAQTLILTLQDPITGVELELFYTIFSRGGILAKKRPFRQWGNRNRTSFESHESLSGSPDCDYDWIQFSGAWARNAIPGCAVWNRASSRWAACGSFLP